MSSPNNEKDSGGLSTKLNALKQLEQEFTSGLQHEAMAAMHRKQTRDDDLEFMGEVDAALMERGKSWAYIVSSGLVVFFILAFISSFFIERDEVTRAEGHVVPSKGVQPVQTEGGIIETILVRENDVVEKDAVLGTISNVKAVNEYQSLMDKKVEYELRLERFDAELSGRDLVFAPEIVEKYPAVVHDQMQLFETDTREHEGKLKALAADLEQRKLEVAEGQQRREQYEKTLLLLKQQEHRILPLVQSKAYSELEYLGLKQRIVSMQSELNTLAGQISRSLSAVQEAQAKLRSADTDRQAEILQDANKTRQELDSVEQMLRAGMAAVEKNTFRSLVRGTVSRILMKEGSVVRPADLIMEIVPLDDGLEIEARFRPQHRGFLEVGQNATIKVSAYDFTTYGTLDAQVISISPDTIEDNKGEPWYEVRLRTDSDTLPFADKDLKIKVGMTVTVDVISGKRSLFAYLAKPLFKTQFKASAVGTVAPPDQNAEQEGAGAQPAP